MKQNNSSLNVTNKAILMIAVPTSLGFLTTPLVGIADTAVVGQLDDAALIGGVSVASVLISLFLTSFNFLRFATSALTAQAHGRDSRQEEVSVLLRSVVIAIITGTLVILFQAPLLWFGLWVIEPSLKVSEAASDYFFVRVWATPFTLLNFVFLSWLVGISKPVTSFLLQSFLNILNIVLTYYFVLHLDLGVAGAAWGTVVAEASTAMLTLFLLVPHVKPFAAMVTRLMFDRSGLIMMMRLNSDIMVRSFCLQASFVFFTRQSAQQTDTILAANEILLHFFMIAGYFLDGFAIAVEQFVGRAFGAKNRETFRKSIWLTSIWNFGQAALLSLIFFISGKAMIDFMTVSEPVREIAYFYLPWAALTPLIGVAAFQMDGIFIGATWSSDMRNSMIASLLLMILAYFALFPFMGNHGLWLALCIFLSFRGVSLYILMKRRAGTAFPS